jgi:dephospho-CoA kinase
MFRLGVTGSIGSGKSTVTKLLKDLGASSSNSDHVAKEILYSMGYVRDALVAHFGTQILDPDGGISRHNLAQVVFNNRNNQKFINNLIHPLVHQETENMMERAERQNDAWFIVDAPLMFESGISEQMDKVLVVTAPDGQRIKRVCERNQMSEQDFLKRDKLQMSQDKKTEKADYIIVNDGSFDDLAAKVEDLFKIFKESKFI